MKRRKVEYVWIKPKHRKGIWVIAFMVSKTSLLKRHIKMVIWYGFKAYFVFTVLAESRSTIQQATRQQNSSEIPSHFNRRQIHPSGCKQPRIKQHTYTGQSICHLNRHNHHSASNTLPRKTKLRCWYIKLYIWMFIWNLLLPDNLQKDIFCHILRTWRWKSCLRWVLLLLWKLQQLTHVVVVIQ